jgi:hypothetical protein
MTLDVDAYAECHNLGLMLSLGGRNWQLIYPNSFWVVPFLPIFNANFNVVWAKIV